MKKHRETDENFTIKDDLTFISNCHKKRKIKHCYYCVRYQECYEVMMAIANASREEYEQLKKTCTSRKSKHLLSIYGELLSYKDSSSI